MSKPQNTDDMNDYDARGVKGGGFDGLRMEFTRSPLLSVGSCRSVCMHINGSPMAGSEVDLRVCDR